MDLHLDIEHLELSGIERTIDPVLKYRSNEAS